MVIATSSIPAITTQPVDPVRLPEWTSLWQVVEVNYCSLIGPRSGDRSLKMLMLSRWANAKMRSLISTSYGDIVRTDITQSHHSRCAGQRNRQYGARGVVKARVEGARESGLHVDFDVLDEAVMSTVDSQESGLNYEQIGSSDRRCYRSDA
jgi:hypothetical protein